MRLLVISDIHGRYDEFMELLKYADFDIKKDYLLNLGDMVDRGPKSYSVVEWFRQNNLASEGRVQTLFGNHEHMMLSYYTKHIPESDYFTKFIGGKANVDSYKGRGEDELAKHLSFISKLPLYIDIDNYIFIHAGLDLSKPLNEQHVNNLCWDYGKFYTQDTSNFDNVFVFGHTPTEYIYKYYGETGNEIWKRDNKICIDCTYSKSRKLLLYDITNDIQYYYSFAQKGCYTKE
jgi:serine/threonine protein phosphatase 1